jgi:peptidoglycan/xylan/chitin deacetylase (PgdA/CDA1 family)
MKNLKFFLSKILWILGIFFIIRWLNRNRVTIIFYHHPKPEILDLHFGYLSKIYRFISIDDFLRFKSGAAITKYSMLITIDDGWKSNIDLLPLLRKYRVKPLIYLCSQVVGTNRPFWTSLVNKENLKYYKSLSNAERLEQLEKQKDIYEKNNPAPQGLSYNDIVALKGHVSFGAHTRTHPVLTQCTDAEQEDEILNSKKELENICGESILHFSAPFGDYDETSLRYIKKAGYLTARTVNKGWNSVNDDNLQLKALAISDNADLDVLKIQLSGLTGLKKYL